MFELLGALVGGVLIYWIASRFTKNPKYLAVIIPVVALLDFAARSYYLPRNRYLIFAVYCAAGWASILVARWLYESDTDRQG